MADPTTAGARAVATARPSVEAVRDVPRDSPREAGAEATPISLPSVVIVTGTGTEVGKTVATAALAAMIRARGASVAVVKPTQTGIRHGAPGDIDVIRDLVGEEGRGASYHEIVRLRDPLAPDVAARREQTALPRVVGHARRIAELATTHDVVLVEGAGGLLVRMDACGGTLADIGTALRYKGVSTGFVIVVAPGLGTLNTTALTCEALRSRSLPVLGLVIGSWPDEPDLAMTENLTDLPAVAGAPLLGRIPDGAGGLTSSEFRAGVPQWLTIS